MTFREKLNSGKFIVTVEVAPPKGISLDKILQEIEPIKKRADAVNVTDLQSSVMRMTSLAASIILKGNGYEPILQMTCRDRNRLALQSELLSAAAFGIKNILALTGDHPSLGDHPQAKPVFDIDVIHLIQVIRKLETGFDMNDNKLLGEAPEFCVGAAVNPGADPLEPEIIKMEKKVAAGAEFFQTQVVFDVKAFEKFLDSIKHLNTKIIAGIMFLKSEKMARYMNEKIPGVTVPGDWINEIENAQDKKKKSIQMCIGLIRDIRSKCAGVHLMPVGWHQVLPQVLDAIDA